MYGFNNDSEVTREPESAEEREQKEKARKARQKAARKAREDAYRSCGLVKVRGALGGVYWE